MQITFTTITLTACREGDKVIIFDRNGQRLIANPVDGNLALEMDQIARETLQLEMNWKGAVRYWASQYNGMLNRRNYSGWTRKAQVWQQSLRWRRNRKQPPRVGRTLNGGRQRSELINWPSAAELLMIQYNQKKARNCREWFRWSETVTRNMRAKNDIRRQHGASKLQESHCEADRKVASNAGIRLRLHGH